MHYSGISLGIMGLISLKKNSRVKFPNDVIFNCVMPRGAKKKMGDSRSTSVTVSSSSINGSMMDVQGACSSFTTSNDCQLRPIVSLLEKLHDPSVF